MIERSAVLSSCKRYRYRLVRTWDASLPVLVFVMLNPSIADAEQDDPTIRKCIGFAQRLGYGGIVVVNLFAWRATDPKALYRQGFMSDYPTVGPENDRFIELSVTEPNTHVVFAWGGQGQRYIQRTIDVKRRIRGARFNRFSSTNVFCLGYSKNTRQPRHPLMLPYATPLEGYIG